MKFHVHQQFRWHFTKKNLLFSYYNPKCFFFFHSKITAIKITITTKTNHHNKNFIIKISQILNEKAHEEKAMVKLYIHLIALNTVVSQPFFCTNSSIFNDVKIGKESGVSTFKTVQPALIF